MLTHLITKFIGLIIVCSSMSLAQVYEGATLNEVDLNYELSKVTPGSVVVIGENHNQRIHQEQQIRIMTTLKSLGHNVHTGLEFVYYPDQSKLDLFRSGQISERQFLEQINWGGDGFEFYREQILFPDSAQGAYAWALNLPRSVTGLIAKSGIQSLTAEQRALLPPNFTPGRKLYKQRFMNTMPHLDPLKAENYFLSQSAWDDTMAWRATLIKLQFPKATLVIISGDFHVAYGGGLPDRLKERGLNNIFTISQVNSEGMSETELKSYISPDLGEKRADLIWVQDLSILN